MRSAASASSSSVPAKHEPGSIEREQRARRHVEPRERAAQHADHLADEPMRWRAIERASTASTRVRIARRSSASTCRSRARWCAASGWRRRARAPSAAATSARPLRRCRRCRSAAARAGARTVIVAVARLRDRSHVDIRVVIAAASIVRVERRERDACVPRSGRSLRCGRARARATHGLLRTAAASRCHRPAATPSRAVRARLRSSCRRCRRGRAARLRLSVSRVSPPVPAARRAAALREG